MRRSIRVASRPIVRLKISRLDPGKNVLGSTRKESKYRSIKTSLRSVGLVKPLVVFPSGECRFRVLDGNKRLDILSRLHVEEVDCIIVTEEEVDRNKRFNYLTPLAEHDMILKALAHHSIQCIASALGVDVETVRGKRDLLDGICDETIDLLKNKGVASKAFAALRKMKPIKQVEAAELMIASNNYTRRFAFALLSGSKADMLIEPVNHRALAGIAGEQKRFIENEAHTPLKTFRGAVNTYGADVLMLSVCGRYIHRLLMNEKVRYWISNKYPDVLQELDFLMAALSKEQSQISIPELRRASSVVRVGSRSRKARTNGPSGAALAGCTTSPPGNATVIRATNPHKKTGTESQ
jgi:hypothetical protein